VDTKLCSFTHKSSLGDGHNSPQTEAPLSYRGQKPPGPTSSGTKASAVWLDIGEFCPAEFFRGVLSEGGACVRGLTTAGFISRRHRMTRHRQSTSFHATLTTSSAGCARVDPFSTQPKHKSFGWDPSIRLRGCSPVKCQFWIGLLLSRLSRRHTASESSSSTVTSRCRLMSPPSAVLPIFSSDRFDLLHEHCLSMPWREY